MLPSLVIFLLALVVLVISSRLIIKYLSLAATSFGLSDFTVAFVLLAIATSMPELFVALSSARQSAGDLIIAVTFGSNLINSTLIIGLAAFISVGIKTHGLNLKRDTLLGAALPLLPLVMLLDLTITKFEGIVLIIAFIVYALLLFRDQQKLRPPSGLTHLLTGTGHVVITLILLAVLIFAADQTVTSAVAIANTFNIPQFLIGLFLIAFGTSLPELTTAIQAALARKPGLALGNIIGSNIANSTLVIGAAGILKPVVVTLTAPLISTVVFMILALGLLSYFARSKQRLSAREGAALIAIFLIASSVTLFVGLA